MVRKVRGFLDYTAMFAFIFSLVWYVFLFTPNVQVYANAEIVGEKFIFSNGSYKTRLGNKLCGKPHPPGRIIFKDDDGDRDSVIDNAEGYGTGHSEITEWKSTGIVPKKIGYGLVTIWKEIYYPCFLGLRITVKSKEVKVRYEAQ
jgi:hypothetical protein